MPEQTDKDIQTLQALTALPTAAGQEDRVIHWIEQWARQRKRIRLQRDAHGNMLLRPTGVKAARRPLVLEAHMDHPAFVVTRAHDKRVEAVFRGGVLRDYFQTGTRLNLHHGDAPAQRGTLAQRHAPRGEETLRITARFDKPVRAAPGDVLRWALPAPRVRDGKLSAPACDDLAGVAAALATLERLQRRKQPPDVRILLTRGEEFGFLGAMAACRSGTIPRTARVVVLENSKQFADAPLGAGPIVRVGDRTSTFDPDLTYRLGMVAERLAQRDASLHWQRKLMPGGTCEASVYQAMGFSAGCVCLPLANYHNMNERRGRIDSERIALGDFHALVRLLVEAARGLDGSSASDASLSARLDALFERRKSVLDE